MFGKHNEKIGFGEFYTHRINWGQNWLKGPAINLGKEFVQSDDRKRIGKVSTRTNTKATKDRNLWGAMIARVKTKYKGIYLDLPDTNTPVWGKKLKNKHTKNIKKR